MNFPMYVNCAVYTRNGQHFVQGQRCYVTDKGKVSKYPPETFLVTSDLERANRKLTLLQNATAKL